HLWRQYEAWVLRHEEHVLANDAAGAQVARANAADVRRKIEAARTLDISPQTLTLQAAVGGQPYVAEVPEPFKQGIASLAREPADRRARYAYAELAYSWTDPVFGEFDAARRAAEDLCLATDEASWKWAFDADETAGRWRESIRGRFVWVRGAIVSWHHGSHL